VSWGCMLIMACMLVIAGRACQHMFQLAFCIPPTPTPRPATPMPTHTLPHPPHTPGLMQGRNSCPP
jgi:hypothetical protein